MAKYRVRTACEVLNKWRTPDEEFELTDAQAEYLKPPHANVIEPVAEATKPALKKERVDGKLSRS